nr:IS630 family transposase [Legionella pneumophila]
MSCDEAPEYHTKKKTSLYKERDEIKRQLFISEVGMHPSDKLVFIDESGIDKFVSREYAWSKKGHKVIGEVSGKRFARESFIAGLIGNQTIAPLCYNGTCDTILFNFWLEHYLLPVLQPGHILIMDNATFHKSEKTKQLIEQAQCKLIFLPPYSPDLNPIEKFWANLKNKIKKVISQFETLAQAIDYVFQSII